MDNKIESNCGEFMDVTYSEDKTIMTMHHPIKHGGVMTRVTMYDENNRPAPMHRATHSMLVELDALYNIVYQHEMKIRREDNEPFGIPTSVKKPLLS